MSSLSFSRARTAWPTSIRPTSQAGTSCSSDLAIANKSRPPLRGGLFFSSQRWYPTSFWRRRNGGRACCARRASRFPDRNRAVPGREALGGRPAVDLARDIHRRAHKGSRAPRGLQQIYACCASRVLWENVAIALAKTMAGSSHSSIDSHQCSAAGQASSTSAPSPMRYDRLAESFLGMLFIASAATGSNLSMRPGLRTDQPRGPTCTWTYRARCLTQI